MPKSATDVLQDILYAAAVDAVVALKDASRGVPNALLRDLAAIHANTAFADLPVAVQAAVATSVRAAFATLRKEGYTIADTNSAPVSTPPRPPRPAPPSGRPPPPPGNRRPPRR